MPVTRKFVSRLFISFLSNHLIFSPLSRIHILIEFSLSSFLFDLIEALHEFVDIDINMVKVVMDMVMDHNWWLVLVLTKLTLFAMFSHRILTKILFIDTNLSNRNLWFCLINYINPCVSFDLFFALLRE